MVAFVRIVIILLILINHTGCATLSPSTKAKRCYNALMALGYSKINQYETCPVDESNDTPGLRPHYDDGYNKRSQIGFGIGSNKKTALDAAVQDAVGLIPIQYDNYRPVCDDNIAQWECTVIVEWHNPPSSLDYLIIHKHDRSAVINYCQANNHSTCVMGNGTQTYINR